MPGELTTQECLMKNAFVNNNNGQESSSTIDTCTRTSVITMYYNHNKLDVAEKLLSIDCIQKSTSIFGDNEFTCRYLFF